MSKEKYQIEATLKNILYFVDDANEQNRMISILEKYNNEMPDGKFKDWLQKQLYKTKGDYYAKVDFLVDDLLSGKNVKNHKDKINQLIQELKPIVEKGEKSFWEKFCNLFNWS